MLTEQQEEEEKEKADRLHFPADECIFQLNEGARWPTAAAYGQLRAPVAVMTVQSAFIDQ